MVNIKQLYAPNRSIAQMQFTWCLLKELLHVWMHKDLYQMVSLAK